MFTSHTETLMGTEGNACRAWGGDCVSVPHWAGWMNEVLRGWTPIIGVRALNLLLFSIHWKALSYGFISFSAPCILNIEWNANVTFKLSKGCWKWTATCREYLVWTGGVVREKRLLHPKET